MDDRNVGVTNPYYGFQDQFIIKHYYVLSLCICEGKLVKCFQHHLPLIKSDVDLSDYAVSFYNVHGVVAKICSWRTTRATGE